MADVLVKGEEVTHLLVTKDESGFFGESPQVPGLVMGRPTETEFRAVYRQVLTEVGVTGNVLVHLQARAMLGDREFLIRCADDGQRSIRAETAARVERCLTDPEQAESMLSTAPAVTGEVVFVAALPADSLGFFMDQLYDHDDALVIAASVADHGLFTMTLGSAHSDTEGWETLAGSGWTRETTVSELLVDYARRPTHHRVLV